MLYPTAPINMVPPPPYICASTCSFLLSQSSIHSFENLFATRSAMIFLSKTIEFSTSGTSSSGFSVVVLDGFSVAVLAVVVDGVSVVIVVVVVLDGFSIAV
ncbi:hypothetical protein [Cardinium endosymbiont of Dermatophagoides farinae]|uniref:hypothetical protein n=1 Tax=Cardinium endosymbiont of Dermatophagoides farinae TaxID=2597823 RepID=UPI001CB9C823|nr:hypothetical protein [Cardinium endosymbiont of Dermatophagoides farinae]